MIARVLRRDDPRWWLPAGLLLGVGLLNKSLVGVVVVGVLACLAALMALNPDAGEMVGWPRFTETVANVYDSIPASRRRDAVIFTGHYGEAGAIAHFGPAHGLPYPYSGHNGWALWGPPPNTRTIVVLVGIGQAQARRDFSGCRLRARIDNVHALENDEQHEPVWLCTGEAVAWSSLWPHLRHYD